VTCHQADYDGATTPDHNDGYPNTCEDCHSTSNWSSIFNHDTQHFPIYTGRHRNEWNLCNECHIVQNVFTTFSCIECHEHSDENQVNNDHDEENDYSYSPTSCYECHPDGSNITMPGGEETPVNEFRQNGGGKP
jgi:hypothetical protein